MNQISFSPLGDRAIILDFGPDISLEMNKKILAMRSLIEHNAFPGLVEIVPAYTTLTVFYEPIVVGPPFPYESVERLLKRIIHQPITAVINKVNKIEIPVCYDQQFAWDLPEVALHNGYQQSKSLSFITKGNTMSIFSDFPRAFRSLAEWMKELLLHADLLRD